MRTSSRLCVASLLLSGTSLVATPALAEAPTPRVPSVAILGIDSDDAEEQADALTTALRSRARAAPGWSLAEVTPSIGAVTVTLKCQAKPDPPCQQRIADHIRQDRYIWGAMNKIGPGQVSAELHLFQRGKPETVIREVFSDNLKDQNDDKLKNLSRRLFEQVTGAHAGQVLVQAGTGAGELVIDGYRHVQLEGGKASFELTKGPHTIDVVVPGMAKKSKAIDVAAGKDLLVEVELEKAIVGPDTPSKPFPTRTVLGGSLLAVGGGLAVTSIVFFGKWIGLKGDESDLRSRIDATKLAGRDVCDASIAKENIVKSGVTQSPLTAEGFCSENNKAKVSSGLAIGLGLGAALAVGAGVYVLTNERFREGTTFNPEREAKAMRRLKVEPILGTTNGLSLSGSF